MDHITVPPKELHQSQNGTVCAEPWPAGESVRKQAPKKERLYEKHECSLDHSVGDRDPSDHSTFGISDHDEVDLTLSIPVSFEIGLKPCQLVFAPKQKPGDVTAAAFAADGSASGTIEMIGITEPGI